MPTLSAAYRLALLLLLLTGCRSEKVAFQFRPAQPLRVRDDMNQHNGLAVSSDAFNAKGTSELSGILPQKQTYILFKRRHWAPHIYATKRERIYSQENKQEMRRPFKRVATTVQFPTQSFATQQVTSKKGTLLQIIGTLLAAAGIALGFVVGGWAGFGLFALLALVGLGFAFWGSFIVDGELP